MKTTIQLISLLFLFFSCDAQPVADGQEKADAATTPAATDTLPPSAAEGWPTPAAYVNDIPVYEAFSQIEPILHQRNDTAYIINFWATWCKPCVEELPYFESLVEASKGKKVRVILISLDFPRQFASRLAPFVQERQLQSTVLALADGRYNDWIDKVSTEWTGAIPATLLYKGENRQFHGKSVKSTAELEALLGKVY